MNLVNQVVTIVAVMVGAGTTNLVTAVARQIAAQRRSVATSARIPGSLLPRGEWSAPELPGA